MAAIDFSLINHPIIVLENEKVLWAFESTSDNQFICRYSMDGGKSWSPYEILIEDFSGEFALTLDQNYYIHLACIDNSGKLTYLLWREQYWHRQNIFTKGIVKSVALATHNNTLELVYLTHTSEKEHRWHVIYTQPNNERSFTIDSGGGHYLNKPVACCDNQGNLHVIYRIFEDYSYRLFYTSRGVLSDKWQIPKPLSIHADNSTPSLIADDLGNIHLVYTTTDGKNLRTTYTKKCKRQGWLMPEWAPPFHLSPEGQNAYTPTLVIKDSQVLALWQQVDGIYRRLSVDEGLLWGKVYKEYHFDDIVGLTPHKNVRNGVKTTSFGPTSADLSLIAASHFGKEEFFSPNPSEAGNHLIIPLDDKLSYLPKTMQYFSRLLNGHLQTLTDERNSLKTQLADAQELIRELQQKIDIPAPVPIEENKVIRMLNKQIDNLQEHIISLNERIADICQEKEATPKDLAVVLPTEPIREQCSTELEELFTEEAEIIPFEISEENKACRVSINFK